MNGMLFVSGCVLLLFLSENENSRNVNISAAKNEKFLAFNTKKSDELISKDGLFECGKINSKLSAWTD
jgi:hypothetical protein